MKERTISLWHRYEGVICFIAAFFFIFLYGLNRDIMAEDYWHDSQIYYEASGTFVVDGQFSFVNYFDFLRGYFFPFILYVFRAAGKLMGGWRMESPSFLALPCWRHLYLR